MKFAIASLLLASVQAECHVGMKSQVFLDDKCTDQHGLQKDVVFDKELIKHTGHCENRDGASSLVTCDDNEIRFAYFKGKDCKGATEYDSHLQWGKCTLNMAE